MLLTRRSVKRFLMTPAIIRTPGLLMLARPSRVAETPLVPATVIEHPGWWLMGGKFWFNDVEVPTQSTVINDRVIMTAVLQQPLYVTTWSCQHG